MQLHIFYFLLASAILFKTAFSGLFNNIEIAAPMKLQASLSPVYLYHLASHELQLYDILKSYNRSKTRPPAQKAILNEYLIDFEQCRDGISGQSNLWDVWTHPFLSYRLRWRFVIKLHPLMALLNQSGNAEETELAAKLAEPPHLGYPPGDEEYLAPFVVQFQRWLEHYEFPTREIARGKFGEYETGVGLTTEQMMHWANLTFALDFFVQSKNWFELLEEQELDEEQSILLRQLKEDLIYYHDLNHENKTREGSLNAFLTPLSAGASPPFKHYELQTWLQTGGTSRTMRERRLKMMALCGNSSFLQMKGRSVLKRTPLRCWQDTKKHPHFTISPLKTEQLYKSPDIFMYHDMIRTEAISAIESMSAPQLLNDSTVSVNEAILKTIAMGWLEKETLPKELTLIPMLEKATGLILQGNASDDIRISLYYLLGDSTVHQDSYRAPNLNSTVVFADRIATVLIYLSELAVGGGTGFPDLELVVQPVKGSVLYWENYYPDGKVDWRTYHGPCPPVFGHNLYTSIFIGLDDNICSPDHVAYILMRSTK